MVWLGLDGAGLSKHRRFAPIVIDKDQRRRTDFEITKMTLLVGVMGIILVV